MCVAQGEVRIVEMRLPSWAYQSIVLPLLNQPGSNRVLSFFPSFSFPDVLCNPIDLIWGKETPFEVMTGSTVSSSDSLLAEVFRGKCQDICEHPRYPLIITLIKLNLWLTAPRGVTPVN